MIKGAQKRMIVIRTQDSSIFEEAYFVMRGGEMKESGDMIAEANRIISSSGGARRERGRDASRTLVISLCCFMGGNLVGAAVAIAITLLSH